MEVKVEPNVGHIQGHISIRLMEASLVKTLTVSESINKGIRAADRKEPAFLGASLSKCLNPTWYKVQTSFEDVYVDSNFVVKQPTNLTKIVYYGIWCLRFSSEPCLVLFPYKTLYRNAAKTLRTERLCSKTRVARSQR